MTGYSWSTPAVDVGAVTVNGPEGQARNEDAAGWDSIDWRACEDQVRRLRQRIFKATRERTSTRNALAARLSRVPRRVARTVLRGPGRGNAPRLPDWLAFCRPFAGPMSHGAPPGLPREMAWAVLNHPAGC